MNYAIWRNLARSYLQKGVSPADAHFSDDPVLDLDLALELKPLINPQVRKEFLELASVVAYARDPDRWSILYRLIYRLNHESPNLLKVLVDPDVLKAFHLSKSVKRDLHKMHAFVRFKEVLVDNQKTYVAWHKPEHEIIELAAPFFVRRFGDRPWSIFTPDGSAHWNLETLSFTNGISQNEFDHRDPFDEIWKTYYKSIFNPARLKLKAMRAEMSPKYWASLPEAAVIQDLIRSTPKRLQNMASAPRYKAKIDAKWAWPELREQALKCSACPLGVEATQTVFGEGNLKAKLMIVGEQPGNEEDLQGRAFVGPAGVVLAKALEAAEIDRASIYVTNAVKHFKFTRTDTKIRLHKKPSGAEMHACKPWLEAEIARIKPRVILALGVTSAMALYGKLISISEERGKILKDNPFAQNLLVSWHPASILRTSNAEDKNRRLNELIADLKLANQVN